MPASCRRHCAAMVTRQRFTHPHPPLQPGLLLEAADKALPLLVARLTCYPPAGRGAPG